MQNAIQAHQNADLSGAEQLYRKAIRLNPRNATAMAVLATSRRDYAAAEQQFRRALSIQADDAGVYCNLGVALRAQRRLEEAVSAYG